MKLEGSVALVVGADNAVGAAIVRQLAARGAFKVYSALTDGACALAQELDDVTLLVNCLVAVQHGASALAGADIQPLGRASSPAGRALELVDAFAPVLAAKGGGAVVNVLSVLCADPPLQDPTSVVSRCDVDWTLSDGLRRRLTSQRTEVLYLRAELAVGSGDQLLGDQRALAGYLATRVLDQLEAAGQPDGDNGSRWSDETTPLLFGEGRRQRSELSD